MALSVGKLMTKMFGSRNDRLLKRYRRIVDQVNAIEPEIRSRTDDDLRNRTQELRQLFKEKKIQMADVLPETLAIMRESMDRNIGIRAIFNPDEHFDPDELDDDMLDAYDMVQQQMIGKGTPWGRVSIPPQIYQAVRKLFPESRPPFRARCFDVQIIGGLALYEGKIAEMATGEGKTFVAPLACYLRAVEGFHSHVVTVNDYLVRRDANWVRPAFENLGLSVGFIQNEMEPGGEARKEAYACDVTYGTNSEFGFDFLRDNMKERKELQVQGPLDYAIVDEVDSILIDEARTPLIISGAAHDDAPKYRAADIVARKIMEMNKVWDTVEQSCEAAKRALKAAHGDEDKAKSSGDRDAVEAARKRQIMAQRALEEAERRKVGITQYYEVEWDRKSVHLTHEGIAAAQNIAGVGSFFVGQNVEWPHLMEQSMRAHVVYQRDKDYVVEKGKNDQLEVVIVDEFTGRKMPGRQWSEGLHQAVEAKERVPIKEETQTLATITLQNFFKMYRVLAGMTGTAMTEAEEFTKIYRLEVVTIPTNRPMIRMDNEDRVYRTEREKWDAVIEEVKEVSSAGRPILVGTTSVERSEILSGMLMRKYGIEHEVLNAKNHEREAQIVAKAGQSHVNVHGETVGNVTIATNMAGRGTDIKLGPDTFKTGGLHVIGTERHTARRIDNQLRGRSGRQGDPGSSRFYVSLQDDLMKMFAGEWTIKVLGWLGMEEGMAIEDKRISRGILRAQRKVEERNFLARKNLLEYDEVMDYQRITFYGMRQQVLEGWAVDAVIWRMIGDSIKDAVDKYITQDYVATVIAEWARTNFEVAIDPDDLRGYRTIEQLENYIKYEAQAEVETNITATLGEFLGEDPGSQRQWDVKGLASWAQSRFHVKFTHDQIRNMDSKTMERHLRDAAIAQIKSRSCAGVMKYLEPDYAERELCNWAIDKFGIELKPEEMIADPRNRTRKMATEIVAMIDERARKAYARREMEYPVDYALTSAFGSEGGNTDNYYSAEYLHNWVMEKFSEDLPVEKIRHSTITQLRQQLLVWQEKFLAKGEYEKIVDELLNKNPDPEQLRLAVNQRFNLRLARKELEPQTIEEAEGQTPLTTRDILMGQARRFFRRELTDLEQYVLIQIFDQSWKDHLYAMDALKSGIGLQAFAERDPRVLYKKEGYRYFEEMMISVRDKVTDLIFRAQVVGAVQARSAYHITSATHEDAGGYGVGENVRRTAGAVAPAGEMQEAADQPQGEVKVKTIRRDTPKVGRNDPCPCGSGKKYKKCCGA